MFDWRQRVYIFYATTEPVEIQSDFRAVESGGALDMFSPQNDRLNPSFVEDMYYVCSWQKNDEVAQWLGGGK